MTCIQPESRSDEEINYKKGVKELWNLKNCVKLLRM